MQVQRLFGFLTMIGVKFGEKIWNYQDKRHGKYEILWYCYDFLGVWTKLLTIFGTKTQIWVVSSGYTTCVWISPVNMCVCLHLVPSSKGGGRTETWMKEITKRVANPLKQENYIRIINKNKIKSK
jgi:hypothetical protein